MLGFPILHYLPKLLRFMSTESVMLSNHLILCCPLLLFPSIFPSIRVVSNELALPIRWLKYWSFSFSISLSDEYSELISFRINCFDLLCYPKDSQDSSPALQFKSINSLALSLPYGPTLTSIYDYWKSHSFDYADFVCEMMSLLFNMLSRFLIDFDPRSKHLFISWLHLWYIGF